jgi:hypothetical protein
VVVDAYDALVVYLRANLSKPLVLLCGEGVLSELSRRVPPKAEPAGFDPYSAGTVGDPITMLTGIDIIPDPSMSPNQWQLVNRYDHSEIIEEGGGG